MEEKYVEYDEDSAAFGVFGIDTGKMYKSFASKEEAEEWVKNHEK